MEGAAGILYESLMCTGAQALDTHHTIELVKHRQDRDDAMQPASGTWAGV